MNLHAVELLTIFQLITIRKSSDGNNIKLQAIKRLYQKLVFIHVSRLESSAHNIVFGPRTH